MEKKFLSFFLIFLLGLLAPLIPLQAQEQRQKKAMAKNSMPITAVASISEITSQAVVPTTVPLQSMSTFRSLINWLKKITSARPLSFKKYQCQGLTDRISLSTCSGIKLAIEQRDCDKGIHPNNYQRNYCDAALQGLTGENCFMPNKQSDAYTHICIGIKTALSETPCTWLGQQNKHLYSSAYPVCLGFQKAQSNTCDSLLPNKKNQTTTSVRLSHRRTEFFSYETCLAFSQAAQGKESDFLSSLIEKKIFRQGDIDRPFVCHP